MTVVVDYKRGNIGSVVKAVSYFDSNTIVSSDPDFIINADKLIVPGVGSFGDCIKNLEVTGLKDAIIEFLKSGKPLLGICVGLQIFFDYSEESPGIKGLGVFKGGVIRFPRGIKVPHMGWNNVNLVKDSLLFRGIRKGEFFYFVHSYYANCDHSIVSGITEYGVCFPSVIEFENVYLLQFHPEKSYKPGYKVIENFVRLT